MSSKIEAFVRREIALLPKRTCFALSKSGVRIASFEIKSSAEAAAAISYLSPCADDADLILAVGSGDTILASISLSKSEQIAPATTAARFQADVLQMAAACAKSAVSRADTAQDDLVRFLKDELSLARSELSSAREQLDRLRENTIPSPADPIITMITTLGPAVIDKLPTLVSAIAPRKLLPAVKAAAAEKTLYPVTRSFVISDDELRGLLRLVLKNQDLATALAGIFKNRPREDLAAILKEALTVERDQGEVIDTAN